MSSLKNDVTKTIGALEKDVLRTSKISESKELFEELPLYNVPVDRPKF